MTRPVQGLVGGAQAAITTSPVAVDLSELKGRTVYIWSDDDDMWFTFAAAASDTTLVTSGASAASTTSLKADRVAKGSKSPRLIEGRFPFLIVRCVTLTGTVHVKVASELDGADAAPGLSSAASGTVSGTVTSTDAAGQEWTLVTQGAMAASFVGLASAGTFRSAFGRIDKTAPSGDYFVQLFNATTATGTATAKSAISHVSGAHSYWSLSAMEHGVRHTTGISMGLSSVEDTFTGAGSYLKVGGLEYKV